jgi:AraC-like DNA-binding protein
VYAGSGASITARAAYRPGVARSVTSSLPAIGSIVSRAVTYHDTGLEPGIHLGLPSPSLTVVLSIGEPTRLETAPRPEHGPAAFMALVGGLGLRPTVIAFDTVMCGLQLDLAPRAARQLFGVPPAELSSRVVDLEDVMGRSAAELVDRLHETDSWSERLRVVDELLGRRAAGSAAARPQVDHAWRLITHAAGRISIADVATAVGWSRRHLDQEFRAEFGLTPKAVSRLARFTRSRQMLQRHPAVSLAELSDAAGFFDQAHMAREWNLLAGMPASEWRAREGHRFFQAPDRQVAASSAL